MKAIDIIHAMDELIKQHGDDTEVIVAWWEADAFDMEQGSQAWLDACAKADDKHDWSSTHDDLTYTIENA